MIENAQTATEEAATRSRWLNPAGPITVAILATFMDICKVNDDRIEQAMQRALADQVDHWGYRQVCNIREEIAEVSAWPIANSRAWARPRRSPSTRRSRLTMRRGRKR